METFFQVKFNEGIRLDCKVAANFQAHVGEYVVVKNDRVLDMGVITSMLGHGHLPEGNTEDLPEIIAHATDADYNQKKINQTREEELLATAIDEVALNELEMKLIKCHTTVDQSLIIFLFTAEGRIDFRQLVKTLSRRLNCRIELRQVGVRDQTAVVGGIGTCGRSFCCSTFLNHFESINVRTAKDQGMPLNPTTISGACGRLKCCLKYEHDGYVEMQKIMPKLGSIFKTQDGDGKVIDINCLKGIVKVKIFSDNPKIIDVDITSAPNKNEPPAKKCGTCSPKGCTGKCHKQKRNKDN